MAVILKSFEQIAQTIHDMRQLAGLTQLQLANLAGVGKTSVFDIEKGKASVQWQTLFKILQALNIHVQIIPPLQNQSQNEDLK